MKVSTFPVGGAVGLLSPSACRIPPFSSNFLRFSIMNEGLGGTEN